MAKTLDGVIVKSVGGIFRVKAKGKTYRCFSRGILKRGEDKLYVGDNVLLKEDKGTFYIADVYPRRNLLIRPYVANVDAIAIVVAPVPKCDWVMVDKLLLSGEVHGIPVMLICNKCDLDDDNYAYAKRVYGELAKIYRVSAETGEGVDDLERELNGVVCLAGQSAVGKSSLLNRLADMRQETGGLSKIDRGRNTTRHIELFEVNDHLSVMDTCGFSLLEPEDVEDRELSLYYPDMVALGRCKYTLCTHTTEPDCVVKQAVEQGRLDQGRYERYVEIAKELTERRKNEYD